MEPIRSCLLGCKESWIACFLNDRAVQTLLSLFCGLLSCVCLRMTLSVRGPVSAQTVCHTCRCCLQQGGLQTGASRRPFFGQGLCFRVDLCTARGFLRDVTTIRHCSKGWGTGA